MVHYATTVFIALAAVTVFLLSSSSTSMFCSAQLFPMKKNIVKNAESRHAVANDGSPMAYYFLPTGNSKDFALMLQGGWSCDGAESCKVRYEAAPELMSSKLLPETKRSSGYLSQDCITNPAFCKHNMVYVNYLSSDFWVGDRNASSEIPYHFRGSHNIRAVIEDLLTGVMYGGKEYKIEAGSRVALIGESAGGIGVLLNCKRMGDLIMKECPSCSVKCMPDSGFFIGSIPDPLENHTMKECEANPMVCSVRREFEFGYEIWNASLEPTCLADMRQQKTPAWMCMAGETAVKYMTYDHFLTSYLFDAAALTADGIFDLLNGTDLGFLTKLTIARRTTFMTFPSFMPSCVGHILCAKQDALTAGGVTLSMALDLWYNSGSKTSWYDKCFTPQCRKGCDVHDAPVLKRLVKKR